MAIHVPLSAEAQAEARILMLSANNLLAPAGRPARHRADAGHDPRRVLPDLRPPGKAEKGAEQVFVTDAGDTDLPVMRSWTPTTSSPPKGRGRRQARRATALKATHRMRPSWPITTAMSACTRRSMCALRATIDGELLHQHRSRRPSAASSSTSPSRRISATSTARDPEHMFDLEIGFKVGKKQLGKIIDRCIQKHGFTVATEVLDNVKALGYKYSTIGAITDLHRGHDRPGGEEDPHRRHGEEGHQHRKAVSSAASSPNDERYRLVVVRVGEDHQGRHQRRCRTAWTSSTPST